MIKMMELADKNVKIAIINTLYIIMKVKRNELDEERSGRYKKGSNQTGRDEKYMK